MGKRPSEKGKDCFIMKFILINGKTTEDYFKKQLSHVQIEVNQRSERVVRTKILYAVFTRPYLSFH
jgi:hypothetical protein